MKTAAIILASGLSRRFGNANKLLHPLSGKPLATHIAETVGMIRVDQRIAVIPHDEPKLAELFSSLGCEYVENAEPALGHGRSLALGVEAALERGCDRVVILLADMPFVPLNHIDALIKALETAEVVMSMSDGRTMPPSVFQGPALQALKRIEGDQGAKQIDMAAFNVKTVELDPKYSQDFDRPQDFPEAASQAKTRS